jgi:hypothetical protein
LHGAKVKCRTLANKILSFILQKKPALRRMFLYCLLCLVVFVSRSQTLRNPVANIYTRTNTYSSVHHDAFSFIGNQSALAGIKNFSVGVFGERRFLLKDLASYQFATALPTSSGNFGLKADYFGSPSYNESSFGFAYGRSLGKIDAGVEFNYYQIKTTGYGNSSAINFEGGMILHVSDQFQTGVHIYNPTRVTIGKSSEERLPLIYSFGMGYDASEKFFIGSEIEKTEDQPVNVNVGLQYSFEEKLFARAGISSGTSSFYMDLGFLISGLRIDATATLHPELGISPGLLLVYSSSAKK